jgi:hypothetical protein
VSGTTNRLMGSATSVHKRHYATRHVTIFEGPDCQAQAIREPKNTIEPPLGFSCVHGCRFRVETSRFTILVQTAASVLCKCSSGSQKIFLCRRSGRNLKDLPDYRALMMPALGVELGCAPAADGKIIDANLSCLPVSRLASDL